MRLKPTPEEENWIQNRLRSASEFCRVPTEWDIAPAPAPAPVPTKPKKKDGEDGDGDADADEDGDEDEDGFGVGLKRVKVIMDEDGIADMWENGQRAALTEAALFTRAISGVEDDGDESGAEQDPEAEALEEIRRKVGLLDAEDESGEEEEGEEKAKGPTALPLGAMLAFGSTGTSVVPVGVHA
jgi:hypothetical protein